MEFLQSAFEQGLSRLPLGTLLMVLKRRKPAVQSVDLVTRLDGFKGTAPGSTAGAALDAFDSCLAKKD